MEVIIMKKKFIIACIVASLFSLVVVFVVFAGTLDYGDVPSTPPVGEVNWTSWLDKKVPTGGGPPEEVITEDNTNSSVGTDQGYSLFGGVPRWVMQVENLTDRQNGDDVSIILGGLGASTGALWDDAFSWIEGGGSTYQGVANTLATSGHSCPEMTSLEINGDQRNLTWRGEVGRYYVYKSTQGSGNPDNDASNGRYLYILRL
jgi:hypothetical protein